MKVSEVYIVSLVERKAVNVNVREPQNPEGRRKSFGRLSRSGNDFRELFSDVYMFYLDF